MNRVGLGSKLIVLLFLAAVFGCAGGKGVVIEKTEPVLLEYALEEGQSFAYKIVEDENTTIIVSVHEQTVMTRSEMDLDMEVIDSSPDGYELRCLFSNIKATMLYGETVEAVDELKELEGRTLEIELDTDGEILGWSGIADTDMAGSGMAELWISGWFPKLPARAVLPGDTWENELDVPSLGAGQTMSVDLSEEYVLESFVLVDGVECARVGVKGEVTLDGRIEEAGGSWQVSGAGTIDGRIIIEVATGLPKSHKVKSNVELEGTNMEEGQTDRDNITIRFRTTSELERISN